MIKSKFIKRKGAKGLVKERKDLILKYLFFAVFAKIPCVFAFILSTRSQMDMFDHLIRNPFYPKAQTAIVGIFLLAMLQQNFQF